MDGSSSKGDNNAKTFLPNYKIGKRLGIGSFGKVKLAEHVPTGYKVAIKILKRRNITDKEAEEKVSREIKILRLFKHPHIIRLYEVIETHKKIYVVMEYAMRGELFDYIVQKGRLQEDEARNLFQQIISGVEYCHTNMVVHRDLKPENILLDSRGSAKIADFGLSNIMMNDQLLKTSCGSPNYAAPEVISGKLYSGSGVDIWSCGVILYALLCGTLPFDDGNISNLFKKIKAGIYTLPSHLSVGARDLIQRILVVSSIDRITIPVIHEHPWFKDRLPHYLAHPLPNAMQQVKKIDEGILQELIKRGINGNHLVGSLHSGIQNEATVAYSLLLDNQFQATSSYLSAEFQEPMECGFPHIRPDEVASSSLGHQLPGYMDHQIGIRPHVPIEKKWALGIQFQARPLQIITEVLKALKELNVAWKKIGHYNLKCRWSPGCTDAMVNNPMHGNNFFGNENVIGESHDVGFRSPNVVKFEVQLYKTPEMKYLLDIKRVNGPKLLFLDLSSSFLTRLQVL